MEVHMEKTFIVANISCGHCVNSIINELTEIDNVQRVEGNAEQKTITVEWSLPLNEAKIRNILKTINYPAD
jgi:copper chaperone CopZ